MRQLAAIAAIAVTAGTLCLAACGSSDGDHARVAAGGAPGPRNPVHAGGTVSVLYAGSLIRLMEQTLAPGFSADTGYRISGFAGGSSELANEVKAGVRQGDVFVSAASQDDVALEGKPNGEWVSWYVAFARAPLVLGYDPGSRFAAALHRAPWYKVLATPGIRVGRTDPVLDPKGQLIVDAVRSAAKKLHDPSLLRVASGTTNVFPEESLLGRLEAGQLDAGFFYLDEARAAGLPTVSLAPVSVSSTFTVTILARTHQQPGAGAFVRYLLGSRGSRALASAGFEVIHPPQRFGRTPAGLLGAS